MALLVKNGLTGVGAKLATTRGSTGGVFFGFHHPYQIGWIFGLRKCSQQSKFMDDAELQTLNLYDKAAGVVESRAS